MAIRVYHVLEMNIKILEHDFCQLNII